MFASGGRDLEAGPFMVAGQLDEFCRRRGKLQASEQEVAEAATHAVLFQLPERRFNARQKLRYCSAPAGLPLISMLSAFCSIHFAMRSRRLRAFARRTSFERAALTASSCSRNSRTICFKQRASLHSDRRGTAHRSCRCRCCLRSSGGACGGTSSTVDAER